MITFYNYENKPVGITDLKKLPTEIRWPPQTELRLDSQNFTLVLFAHPKCPCSRASLSELIEILSRTSNIKAYIVFVIPSQKMDEWTRAALVQAASGTTGVQALIDRDGVQTKFFNAHTSGETFLYDREGHLVFHGGITGSRGHIGDNRGRSFILRIVAGEGPNILAKTFVFGCGLFGMEANKNVRTSN